MNSKMTGPKRQQERAHHHSAAQLRSHHSGLAFGVQPQQDAQQHKCQRHKQEKDERGKSGEDQRLFAGVRLEKREVKSRLREDRSPNSRKTVIDKATIAGVRLRLWSGRIGGVTGDMISGLLPMDRRAHLIALKGIPISGPGLIITVFALDFGRTLPSRADRVFRVDRQDRMRKHRSQGAGRRILARACDNSVSRICTNRPCISL